MFFDTRFHMKPRHVALLALVGWYDGWVLKRRKIAEERWCCYVEQSRCLKDGNQIQTSVALCTAVSLIVAFVLNTLSYVGLYADGADYFLTILCSRHFLHVSPYRIGATYLTQWPIVLAIGLGERSIAILATLHTAALMAVPTVSFVATTWITRRNAIAAVANVLVICCCYFPIMFIIIAENQVLYSLFWLCSVLVFLHPLNGGWSFTVLIAAGILMLRSYELTVVTGVLLSFACAARATKAQASIRRGLWIVAAALFLLGVPLGLQGILVPRDAGNAAGFRFYLRTTLENHTLLELLGITGVAGLAILFRNTVFAVASAVVASYAAWRWFIHALNMPIHTDLLGLGYQNAQRAQVFPLLLGAFVLLVLARLPLLQRIAQHNWQQWPLLVPLCLVLAVHLVDLRDWRGFVHEFCTELQEPNGKGNRDVLFLTNREARRFAWNWELPTLSVLLRDSGSDRIILDASYSGWLPFNPVTATPDIRGFKRSGGLCS